MGPTVINYVEEYFHTLNPLAKRIVEEIAHTREAYETLWDALSVPEQRQILDEAIIRPEAVLKYSRSQCKDKEEPRIQTGAKYVFYEDGSSGKGIKWRDEHSAPFSWLTRSQQDLRIFGSDDPVPSSSHQKLSKSSTPVRKSRPKPPAPPAPMQLQHMDPPSLVLGGSSADLITCTSPTKQTILNKLISKTAVFKLPFAGKVAGPAEARSCSAELESLLSKDGCGVTPKIVKPSVLKPKSPPPPPPAKPAKKMPPPTLPKPQKVPTPEAAEEKEEEFQEMRAEDQKEGSPLLPATPSFEIDDNSASAIPKTGFEFLDNW
ncbi:hypothetical protein B566_EDAN015453 [Ephemera danica]|nr:hypothetical protein B566_EDAN015453 [Ephemera danica]